jgi:hypothetical protein
VAPAGDSGFPVTTNEVVSGPTIVDVPEPPQARAVASEQAAATSRTASRSAIPAD